MPNHITKEYEFADCSQKIAVHKSYHKYATKHVHNFFELMYVVRGKILHVFNGEHVDMLPGDYSFFDLNDIHSYTTEDYEGDTPLILNLMFDADLIDPELKHCRTFSELFKNPEFHIDSSKYILHMPKKSMHDQNGEILTLIEQIQSETQSTEPISELILHHKLITLILSILRLNMKDQTISEKNPITIQILNTISQKYYEDNLLIRICNELNYSISYLSNIFRTDMGIGFKEYLQSFRISEAENLLVHTNLKIEEVSKKVGYQDTKYFYNLFKKYTHMTPAQYRKISANAEKLSL